MVPSNDSLNREHRNVLVGLLCTLARCATLGPFLFLLALGYESSNAWGQFPPEAFDWIPKSEVLSFPGTERLTLSDDIASQLVDGVDTFLKKQIDVSRERRRESWPVPATGQSISPKQYSEIIEPIRQEYRRRIGWIDPILPTSPWIVESAFDADQKTKLGDVVASGQGIRVVRVHWPVLEGFDASGLMVVPDRILFGAVLIPDADQMPESLCSQGEGANQNALQLAKAGGLVVIPQVISRHREARAGRAIMTDQEYLYRSAFVLGRHLLGYHVQQCVAAIDRLKASIGERPILVAGWGEGGWIALAVGASDVRVDGTIVSGHFGPREQAWQEPIHRNVHGLLTRFGDGQLASLIAPRLLIVDAIPGPDITIGGDGGAPGRLQGPSLDDAQSEIAIARRQLAPWKLEGSIRSIEPESNAGRYGIQNLALAAALNGLPFPDGSRANTSHLERNWGPIELEGHWDRLPSAESRRLEMLHQLDRFQQRVLDRAHIERESHWKSLDTTSIERFQETVEPFRKEFRDEIIGRWDIPKSVPRPRTRLVYEREKWRGYEVVLDVFDDVIAYGVLLVPKSNEPLQKRPCVVFQHGLEGRPTDTIVGDHPAYHDVSARLAEEGYIVFAPQNLYLFKDRFRTLQRKSNLLGKTLFSTIIAQHEQIVHWLASLPEVDPERIAFYGLSYGGKSAMRIPALVPEYCLSICSADFNDWVWKNASTSSPYSYVWTMEYEIFEFDLGPKFNYAEMAALIAPRPFMVERGHFDGVAPDERVALEYAKVQRLYAAKLGIPDRTRIEWFPGPHTIHGVGTFEFLRQQLKPEWINKPEPINGK
ncbi:MAG: dienelactone hydrolase family protein [Planctomycetota bacterium]